MTAKVEEGPIIVIENRKMITMLYFSITLLLKKTFVF